MRYRFGDDIWYWSGVAIGFVAGLGWYAKDTTPYLLASVAILAFFFGSKLVLRRIGRW